MKGDKQLASYPLVALQSVKEAGLVPKSGRNLYPFLLLMPA
ncbi:hypothetical protein [Erwinia pyrifoliae]